MFSLPYYTGVTPKIFWKNAMINFNNAAQSIVVKSSIYITSFCFLNCYNIIIVKTSLFDSAKHFSLDIF